MGILLVRHSDAVDGGGELDDAARWLSARGRTRARASARALAAKGLSFDRFVASPRVRAVQTAELYAEALGFRGVVESLPALSFSEPAEDAIEALGALSGNIAAFGHMPTLADIVRALGHEKQARGMATSEAVWIENGRVVFRLPPTD
jgi:phosphohistidine phosphatase